MLILTNWTAHRFIGWVPCTSIPTFTNQRLTQCPAYRTATGEPIGTREVFFGSHCGQVQMAWVKVDLQANESIAIDLAQASEVPKPAMRGAMVVAQLTVNQIPLQVVSEDGQTLVEYDGPAMRVHLRAKVSATVWCDVWLSSVPGERWSRFEAQFNAADPTVPITVEDLPAGFDLRYGSCLVGFLGSRFGPVMRMDSMAQSQARQFAGVIFDQSGATHEDIDSATALLQGAPFGVDQRLEQVVAGLGVPERGATFSAARLVYAKFSECIKSLYAWPSPGIGIAQNSVQTGEQEDQCFSARGTECFGGLPVNAQAAFMRYAVALGYAKRPCMWREPNGDLLHWEGHQDLVLWSGNIHPSRAVSPDRRGLESPSNTVDTHLWWGPDREHWFNGSLFLAAMLTGSRALQFQLENQARVVWYQETVDPRLSTSHPGAARAVGWFGILAVGLWNTLRDRRTAERVRERALQRIDLYSRELDTAKWPAWVDVRNDPRLSKDLACTYRNVRVVDPSTEEGTRVIEEVNELPVGVVSYSVNYLWPRAVMVYQQALCAFGLQVMGEAFESSAATILAGRVAEPVVRFGYTGDEEAGWLEWSLVGVPPGDGPLPPEQYVAGQGANRGSFRHAWMPLALWVLLRQEPGHTRARQIWDSLRREVSTGGDVLAWFPPLERQVATRWDNEATPTPQQ